MKNIENTTDEDLNLSNSNPPEGFLGGFLTLGVGVCTTIVGGVLVYNFPGPAEYLGYLAIVYGLSTAWQGKHMIKETDQWEGKPENYGKSDSESRVDPPYFIRKRNNSV